MIKTITFTRKDNKENNGIRFINYIAEVPGIKGKVEIERIKSDNKDIVLKISCREENKYYENGIIEYVGELKFANSKCNLGIHVDISNGILTISLYYYGSNFYRIDHDKCTMDTCYEILNINPHDEWLFEDIK